MERLGLSFAVRPVDLDETPRPGEAPDIYVERLAREKAEAQAHPGELILAADTIVALEGKLLGKPKDPADAHQMLRQLSGRSHLVATGVALHNPSIPQTLSAVERTTVHFAELSDEEITWYVATGEPMDKAGAYGIQGLGSLFVPRIEGNYLNVVGLPLPAVVGLFRRAGVELLGFAGSR